MITVSTNFNVFSCLARKAKTNFLTKHEKTLKFVETVIAERLSVRLIIVQARRALVWGCVCMSVRYEFTMEIYGFMHSLRTFWHVPLMMPLQYRSAFQSSNLIGWVRGY